MNLNLWIALPEDVHNELNQGREDENNNLSDIANRFARGQLDPGTVLNLYKQRRQGPNTWHLWSIILTAEDHNDVVSQVNSFRQEYPGAQVMGLWKPDGAMYGCELVLTEVPNPDYVGEPYMIPNPAYQPDPEQPDYDPRAEIRNPAWVPETITERSQSGDPQYVPGNISFYMPDDFDEDGNPVPNNTPRDVNLPAGWSPRIFV